MIEIVLPYVPSSLNGWQNWHWGKKAKYKKQITNDIFYLCNSREQIKFCGIEIEYYFATNRRRDLADNYNPKFILDALVQNKIILDDRTSYIGIPKLSEFVDKGNAHTLIRIIPTERGELHDNNIDR